MDIINAILGFLLGLVYLIIDIIKYILNFILGLLNSVG